MNTNSIGPSNSGTFGSDVRALKTSHEKGVDGPFGQAVSEMAHQRNEARRAASEPAAVANNDVSITVGDEQNSLTLLLKTSVDGVNTALNEAGLEIDQIQVPSDYAVEITPDTTAEQIVALSTSAFGVYADANPEQDLTAQLDQFISLILSGIDEGFSEARNTLDLAEAPDDNATSIDATYELVNQKLIAFKETLLANSITEEPAVEEPSVGEPAVEEPAAENPVSGN